MILSDLTSDLRRILSLPLPVSEADKAQFYRKISNILSQLVESQSVTSTELACLVIKALDQLNSLEKAIDMLTAGGYRGGWAELFEYLLINQELRIARVLLDMARSRGLHGIDDIQFDSNPGIEGAGCEWWRLFDDEWLLQDRDRFLNQGEAALRMRGLPENVTVELRPLIEALFAFLRREKRPLVTDPEFGEVRSIVLCAGFGWSGSGAVFDYLRSHEGFYVFSYAELYAFANECTRLYKGLFLAREDRDYMKNVFEYLSVGLLGIAPPGSNYRRAEVIRMRSVLDSAVLKPWRSTIGHFVQATSRWLNELLVAWNGHDCIDSNAVVSAFSRYFRAVFTEGCRKGEVVLLNNIMRPYNAPLVDEWNIGLVTIAVTRDPRDQYVDTRTAKGEMFSVSDYIESYRTQREKFMRAEFIHQQALVVRFEDFVIDDAVRAGIFEKLGFDHPPRVMKARFEPEKSIRNVGIYRGFHAQEDIRDIESALSCFIV